jgi:hypothetical protein
LVEGQNGIVKVISERGKGTIFRLIFFKEVSLG